MKSITLVGIFVALVVALGFQTGMAQAAPVKHKAPTYKVKRTHNFIVLSVKTKHGWKTSKHRVRYNTRKFHYSRHCKVSKAGGKRHVKCGPWHRKLRPQPKRTRAAVGRKVGFVLPWRVVRCESGGNWRAVNMTAAGVANGIPGGAYQITRPTWRAYGGLKYAPNAESAPPYAQNIIALRVLHGQGPRAWACW